MTTDTLFMEMYARDLMTALAETDEALEYWENADEDELYEVCEANGYEWYSGGWYTPEFIEDMKRCGL